MRASLILLIAFAAMGGELTGYISDAACGWNNARAAKEAKECAQKCVKAGWDPVFVPDGKMDAFKIKDKAKALPYVGEHVQITGSLHRDLVTVQSIRKLGTRLR
jgi:hypothetical protein